MYKEAILNSIKFLPLKILFRPFYSGKGSILFMHKVIEKSSNKNRINLMRANEIELAFLESMIVHLKKRYDIISLDECYSRLKSQQLYKKNFIVITFDDGYKDNLTLAYPIFKKHQVPFTIYITNSFPNYTAKLWWFMLEEILLENKEIRFTINNNRQKFKSRTKKEKDNSFVAIRKILIDASEVDLKQILNQLEVNYNKNLISYVKKEALNWEEIKELSNDPLVTIGCHTINHLTLKLLSEAEIIEEIIKSKEELEIKTGVKVNHFAYPYGTSNEIGEREINVLNKLNIFKTSTTTRTGNIFNKHKEFKNALPRIQVLGTQQEISILDMYLSGFLPAFKNNFKRITTL